MPVNQTRGVGLQDLVGKAKACMSTLDILKMLAATFLDLTTDADAESAATRSILREFLVSDMPAGHNLEFSNNIPNFDNPRIELENCMAQLEKVPSPSIKQQHAALKGDVTAVCAEAESLSKTRLELQQHLREAIKVRDERLNRMLDTFHANPKTLPSKELSEFKKIAVVFLNIQKTMTTLQDKGPSTLETINKLTNRTRVLLGSEESKASQAPKLTK